MAYYKFTEKIVAGKPIEVFHHGQMPRDFTYIGDIIEGLCRIIYQKSPHEENNIPYSIYNIGRGQPITLLDFITKLEKNTGKSAIKKYLPQEYYRILAIYIADYSFIWNYFNPLLAID
jgi:UDP-glucuronate 4-epimerase